MKRERKIKVLYLDERPLGELLVDFGFVHDVFGSAGVLQRAQSLLHRQNITTTVSAKLQTSMFYLCVDRTNLQVAGRRRHGGNDGGLCPSSQRVLKDSGQLRLSVRRGHVIY